MKIITLIIVCLIAGCSMEVSTANQTQNKIRAQSGTIIEYQLKDGTRCAVYDGVRAGGLSCDWRN